MSFKKRASILSLSAAAAAVLISIPVTAGAASAATAVEYGATSAASAKLPTVQENAAGTGLVLVPVPGVAQTTKVYNGLTATSSTARQVPDSDGAHPAVRGKATVSPATEPTTYVETGPFNIYNKDNNACLDADANTIGSNGTKVQLWQYIDGNTNQWWYVNGDGTIANQDTKAGIHMYLDADTNTIANNGTKIQLWQLVGGPNQYWY